MHLVPGERFGRYVVQAELGRGGQASVYRARQVGTERAVALKVFTQIEDAAALTRFRREAVAAARVEHPRIVTVYESGDVGGVPFIAMRLVPGPSLAEVLSRFGAIAPHRALAIMEDVAEAVDAAHRSGLVHRDIKPANVLLDLDDRAFLSDFGVARMDDLPGLTQHGDWLGTVEYISPEQAAGHPATPASDIYAFGVLAYEVLGGRPPFVHRQPSAVVLAHVREAPPSVAAANPVLPVALDLPLGRALAKDPLQRPRQARDLVADLRTALAGWSPPPPATPQEGDAWTRVLRGFSTGDGPGAADTRVMPPVADTEATRAGRAVAAPAPPPPPVPPRRGRRRRVVLWTLLGILVLLGGGAYAGWTVADRRAGDIEAAKATAYRNGFRNGRARGAKDGRAAGLKEGTAQGLRQGRAEGRREGLAEGRTVPDAAPGQFRVVRVADDGSGEYRGDPLPAEGGCFVIDADGQVNVLQTLNAFNACSILRR